MPVADAGLPAEDLRHVLVVERADVAGAVPALDEVLGLVHQAAPTG